jgi:hypothetical protein
MSLPKYGPAEWNEPASIITSLLYIFAAASEISNFVES